MLHQRMATKINNTILSLREAIATWQSVCAFVEFIFALNVRDCFTSVRNDELNYIL